MPDDSLTRREVLAALASIAAVPLVSACTGDRSAASATASAPNEAKALALLDELGENFIHIVPEQATSLGIDIGARAGLRSLLTDRSAEGVQKFAAQLRTDLARLNAFDTSGLSYATRTSVDVVRSVYASSLEGFALP